MASQVLSGSSNVTYTNNTGQNVRLIINYMSSNSATYTGANTLSISWAGNSISSAVVRAIGRNLAFSTSQNASSGTMAISANNMATYDGQEFTNASFPTEIMLSSGQSFSATCGVYNIIVIPEAG